MGDFIDIGCEGGSLRAYRALPASGRGPAVVVLQEIFGVNAAMRAVADDLAAQGFVALAPDLFWRLQPGMELDYHPEGMAEARAAWGRFDLEQGVADAAATVEAARGLAEGTGRVAVLGFCLGGQLAVKTAARTPVDAAVSFYGVQLDKSRDEIAAITAPLQVHYGDADPHISPEAREVLDQAAAARSGVEVFVYSGAGHGFFNSFRPAGHDAEASRQAHARVLQLLRSALHAEPATAA
jgi:carboxymethylenebutenolidase